VFARRDIEATGAALDRYRVGAHQLLTLNYRY